MKIRWMSLVKNVLFVLALLSLAGCPDPAPKQASVVTDTVQPDGGSADPDSSNGDTDTQDSGFPGDSEDADVGADASDSGLLADADSLEPGDSDISQPSDGDVQDPVDVSDGDVQDPVDVSDGDAQDAGDVGGGDSVDPPNACLPAGEGPDFKVAARADLRWKRAAALEADLLNWLQLTPLEACSEVGISGICFNLVHQVPLGGNDPIYAAMYTPISKPGVTSMLSTERVVVAACGRRADLDAIAVQEGGIPTVFTDLDFTQDVLSPQDSGVSAQIESLYRLMLAREATEEEVALLTGLASPLAEEPAEGISPRDFAKTACFVVATTSEALLH